MRLALANGDINIEQARDKITTLVTTQKSMISSMEAFSRILSNYNIQESALWKYQSNNLHWLTSPEMYFLSSDTSINWQAQEAVGKVVRSEPRVHRIRNPRLNIGKTLYEWTYGRLKATDPTVALSTKELFLENKVLHKSATLFTTQRLIYFLRKVGLNRKDITFVEELTSYQKLYEITFLNFFIAWKLLNQESLWNIVVETKIMQYSFKSVMEILKAHHTQVRKGRYDYFTDSWLSLNQTRSLQYFKTLLGRIEYKSLEDLKTDIIKRMYPNVPKAWVEIVKNEKGTRVIRNHERWKTELQKEIKDLLTKAIKTTKLTPRTLREAWKIRLIHVPGGSASGAKMDIPVFKHVNGKNIYTKRIDEARLTKKALMESLTWEDVQTWLSTYPCMRGNVSRKFENAKTRLLISTEVGHQFLSDYVLQHVESTMSVFPEFDITDKEQQTAQRLGELRSKMMSCAKAEKDLEPFMFDFDDFNIQHDADEMAYVWMTISEIMTELATEYSDTDSDRAYKDLAMVSKWVGKSELNSYVIYKGKKYPQKRGLFTGERSTMFKNTLFNLAYCNVVKRNYKELFGYDVVDYQVNHGDDVFMVLRRRNSSILLGQLFNLMGLLGQGSKILTEDGEFLRMSYGTDGTVTGYPVRAITSLTSKDPQRDSFIDPINMLKSLVTKTNTLLRRCIVCQQPIKHLEEFLETEEKWYESFVYRKHTSQGWVKAKAKIDANYKKYSTQLNGLGTLSAFRPGLVIGENYRQLPKRLNPTIKVPKNLRLWYGSNMTDDFWNQIIEYAPEILKVDAARLGSVKHTLHADNIIGSLPNSVKGRLRSQTLNRLRREAEFNRTNITEIDLRTVEKIDTSIPYQVVRLILNDMQHMQVFGNLENSLMENFVSEVKSGLARSVVKRPDIFSLVLEGKRIAEMTNTINIKQILELVHRLGIGNFQRDIELQESLTSLHINIILDLLTGNDSYNNILIGLLPTSITSFIRTQALIHTNNLMRSTAGLRMSQIERLIYDVEIIIRHLLFNNKLGWLTEAAA